MQTTTDLREALAELADHAPHECDVPLTTHPPIGPARRHRRVRAVVPAAVAAVAVAAVVSVSAVAAHHVKRGHDSQPAATRPRPTPPATTSATIEPTSPRSTFAVGAVPGYDVWRTTVDRRYQAIELGSTGVSATVTIFEAGVYSPSLAERGQPVTVNGHRGYYANIGQSPLTFPPEPDNQPLTSKSVVWEYAPDAWAVSQLEASNSGLAGHDVRADELRIAEAVHATPPQPLRLPFRLGYRPSTAVLKAAGSVLPANGNWAGTLGFDDSTSPVAGRVVGETKCTVWVGPIDPRDQSPTSTKGLTPIVIDGHHGYLVAATGEPGKIDRLELFYDNAELIIRGDNASLGSTALIYSKAELVNLAKHVTLASDLSNPSTWFDATTALPH